MKTLEYLPVGNGSYLRKMLPFKILKTSTTQRNNTKAILQNLLSMSGFKKIKY